VIIGGWREPSWRVAAADPCQIRQVRDWIRSAAAGYGCPAGLDDAALIVGELATNAVMHGPAGGRMLAGYCRWDEGARIVICDGGGPGTPQLREAGTWTEGGRGLHVVEELSARWGSFRLPRAQVVWCDLGQPLRAPDADAWAWLHLLLSARDLSAPPGAPETVTQPALARTAAR
jgi:anti-sigma regulatory factor (Ser/Thr protein kinase)